MIIYNAVREVMKLRRMRLIDVAERLGVRASLIADRLGQENISIGKLEDILRVMDYKIAIVPKEAKLPDGAIYIEKGSKKDE